MESQSGQYFMSYDTVFEEGLSSRWREQTIYLRSMAKHKKEPDCPTPSSVSSG
jgi:hypothetical protein